MKKNLVLWALTLVASTAAWADAETDKCVDFSGDWSGTCVNEGKSFEGHQVITQSGCYRILIDKPEKGEHTNSVAFVTDDYSIGHLNVDARHFDQAGGLDNVLVFKSQWNDDQSVLKMATYFFGLYKKNNSFFPLTSETEMKIVEGKLVDTTSYTGEGGKIQQIHCTSTKK